MALAGITPQDFVQPIHLVEGAPAKTILNLGCGPKYLDNAVNLDRPTFQMRADVRHDLNVFPWPLDDNTFEEVVANDVVEHLQDVIRTMEEIHRVCRPGAVVRITVPHFSCANAYTDPTHVHYFGASSFDYITREHAAYSEKRFRMRKRQIVFEPTLLNKLVWRMAERNPAEYERRWAWIFPAWFLSFELEVVK